MANELEEEQLALAHRQSGTMLIFTMSLIAFLLFVALGSMGGPAFIVIILLPTPFCILIVRGYFKRESWALPWVTVIWMVAIGLCGILMVYEFASASAGTSSLWGYVQGLLLLFLCWSMSQRLKLLRHPLFRAWYDGNTPAMNEISLQPDELLASCPHCESLLAIQPLSMSSNEKCPQCNLRLVSVESVQLYMEEE